MSKALDDIRAKLLEEMAMEELLKPGKRELSDRILAEGIRDVPVRKFMEQQQYLEKELLPAIEKKKGKGSTDYIFFEAVGKSLVWAMILCDRYDYQQRMFLNAKIDSKIARELAADLQAELSKFETLEQLFFAGGLDRYADGVKMRAKALQEREKK